MNNEKYNQIIDEVYRNYLIEDAKVLSNMSKEKMTELGFGLTKEEFINKCKTDNEFSERWGLKIEERELSLNDRILEFAKRNLDPSEFRRGGNYGTVIPKEITLEVLNNHNIPTKLITVSYKNKTIESYE